jgi:hypothetical protein
METKGEALKKLSENSKILISVGKEDIDKIVNRPRVLQWSDWTQRLVRTGQALFHRVTRTALEQVFYSPKALL